MSIIRSAPGPKLNRVSRRHAAWPADCFGIVRANQRRHAHDVLFNVQGTRGTLFPSRYDGSASLSILVASLAETVEPIMGRLPNCEAMALWSLGNNRNGIMSIELMFKGGPHMSRIRVRLLIVALLLAPMGALAQSGGGSAGGGSAGGGAAGGAASGPSAGTESAVGSPNAGSAGAGTAGFTGVPSGPANVGGLNNSGNDPSGAGNSAKLPTAHGTNSLGTANSSGSTGNASTGSGGSTTTVGRAADRTGAATGGRIDGTVTQGPAMPGDAAIRAEDAVVDKKIKSICKGC